MVGYFVPNKWLETQVWQSCDKRSTQIVNVALRNAWQMPPLEHGEQCIVDTAAMNRLFIAQGRSKCVALVSGNPFQFIKDLDSLRR